MTVALKIWRYNAETGDKELRDYEVEAPKLTPNTKGTAFTLKQAGMSFIVRPDKSGSSRAKFTVKVIDDLTGVIDPDAVLAMHFVSFDVDATGAVTLDKGKYKLGKTRGALIEPALYLYKTKAKLKAEEKAGRLTRKGAGDA